MITYLLESKIAFFFHPCICALLTGFLLELGTDARSQKTKMMWLSKGQNSFEMGLAV